MAGLFSRGRQEIIRGSAKASDAKQRLVSESLGSDPESGEPVPILLQVRLAILASVPCREITLKRPWICVFLPGKVESRLASGLLVHEPDFFEAAITPAMRSC